MRVPSDDEDDFDYDEVKQGAPLGAGRKSPPSSSQRVPISAQATAVSTMSSAVQGPSSSEKDRVAFGGTATSSPVKNKVPPLDVSRMIRKAYESVEPVKLKALPDNDPSMYCWKVLHSLNQQKLGYASVRQDDIDFFDLRGHKVLKKKKKKKK